MLWLTPIFPRNPLVLYSAPPPPPLPPLSSLDHFAFGKGSAARLTRTQKVRGCGMRERLTFFFFFFFPWCFYCSFTLAGLNLVLFWATFLGKYFELAEIPNGSVRCSFGIPFRVPASFRSPSRCSHYICSYMVAIKYIRKCIIFYDNYTTRLNLSDNVGTLCSPYLCDSTVPRYVTLAIFVVTYILSSWTDYCEIKLYSYIPYRYITMLIYYQCHGKQNSFRMSYLVQYGSLLRLLILLLQVFSGCVPMNWTAPGQNYSELQDCLNYLAKLLH